MTKTQAKNEIRDKIDKSAFTELQNMQMTHQKVKHIVYTKLETQPYLKTANITNKEAEIITALRSHTLRGIRNNFHTLYKDNQQCPLCQTTLDTQEHCLKCPKIFEKIPTLSNHIKYEQIYGNITEQREIAQLYIQIMNKRTEIIDNKEKDDDNQHDDQDDHQGLPGVDNTGPDFGN